MRRRPMLVALLAVAAIASVAFAGEITLWWGSRDVEGEAVQLADLLEVRAGDTVADIGAGTGRLLPEMAARVTPSGRVYATELDPERLELLRGLAQQPALRHVTIVPGQTRSTGLPDACCRIVYMRHVFHHIEDVEGMTRDLHRIIPPGGKLAVIDFEPRWFLNLVAPLQSARRPGHGITAEDLIADVTGAGFTAVRRDDWRPGMFLVVFAR